jgi:hypothetical protein
MRPPPVLPRGKPEQPGTLVTRTRQAARACTQRVYATRVRGTTKGAGFHLLGPSADRYGRAG